MKRLLAVVVGLALALIGSVAVAAWLSSGSGTATATATTVDKANQPTASRDGAHVKLEWAASTLANDDPVGGYKVVRSDGADVCSASGGRLTCDDPSPLPGSVQYRVIATIGTNWEGPPSDPTTFKYDTQAPSTTASISPSPSEGWNNSSPVTVTLDATDDSGVDHITYTLDGGPEQTVANHSSFIVSGSADHTVTFFAVDVAGNTEATNTQHVLIDPNSPVTSYTPNPVPTWSKDPVTLDFTAADANTGATSGVKSVTVDGATTLGSTASTTVSAEGTTVVHFHATDVAGNEEGDKTVSVQIDKTAPTDLTITPADSATWRNNGAVTLSASDVLSGLSSIEYKIDSAPSWTTYTAPFTLADGSHTVDYRATDVAGNVTNAPQATIKVDTVKPTSTIANTTSTTWTITASDAAPSSGVSIEYWVDNGTHTSVAGSSAVLTVTASGTIHWFAKDAAGNLQAQQDLVVTISTADTTGPTMTNLDPADGFDAINNNTNSVNAWVNKACSTGKLCLTVADVAGVNASSITFNLRGTSGSNNGKCWNGSAFATGTGCAVTMSFDSSTGRATSANIPQSAMLDGAYSITYKAKDTLGNETVTTIAVTIN